jgi:hypothetical protein
MKKSTEALKKADLSSAKPEAPQTTRKSRAYLKTDDLLTYFRNEGKDKNQITEDGVAYVYKKDSTFIPGKDLLVDEETIHFIPDPVWPFCLFLKREIQEVKE